MRLILILGLAALPLAAAAQMTEEAVEVPTSPATRSAEQADIDAREAEEQEAEAQEAEATAQPDATPEPQRDWREVASAFDIERIERNEEGFAAALELAAAGSAADQAELARVFGALPQPIDAAALPGRWLCRTIRFTDEPAGFRIYDWFECRISQLSNGLLLEKLGGSELTSGLLYPDSETRMIYLGHAHRRDEPARDYDGQGGPEGDDPSNPDDPAVLTQRAPDRLLLAKPFPVGDPAYDLLELRRP